MALGSGGSPCCLTHTYPALAAERANPFQSAIRVVKPSHGLFQRDDEEVP
jgi:hypothetical protein